MELRALPQAWAVVWAQTVLLQKVLLQKVLALPLRGRSGFESRDGHGSY